MARQDDWGAAEPIRQVGVRAYNAVRNIGRKVPPRASAPRDTSTHDRMVSEANESFRRRAEREKTAARPAARPAARSATKRKTATRSSQRRSSR